jgi:hypothetical protein
VARSGVVDTSLLVLLVVGNTDRTLIKRHKNVFYDEDGFDLLVEKLEEYSQVVSTPNALTEASNLLRQIRDPDRSRVTLVLGALIHGHHERYVVSKEVLVEETFRRLGPYRCSAARRSS